MSVEKEAVVTARLDGVTEVVSGFRKMGEVGSSAGSTISGGFKAAGGAIKDAVQGVISDLGHVVTAAAAIDFVGSIREVERFEESVARMSIGTRHSIGMVRDSFNELAAKNLETPQAVNDFVSTVGKQTYSPEGAAASYTGAKEYSLETNQTMGEVAPLVTALEQISGAAGKSGRELEVLVTQAKALGTVGGPKALGDAMVALQGQLSEVSGTVASKSALVAGFGGTKAYQTPQQRAQGLGSILSRVESNPEGFERAFGVKLTDEYGNVDATKAINELQKFGRHSAGQRKRLEYTFGRRNAAGIMDTDVGAIVAQRSAAPSKEGEQAAAAYADSEVGKRKKDEVNADIKKQENFGAGSVMGGAFDWIKHQAAEHPILATVGAGIGLKGANAAVGAAAKGASSFLFGGGGEAAAAGGTASSTVAGGGGGTLLAEGLGGLGLGALGTVLGSAALAGKFLTGPLVSSGFRDDVDLTKGGAAELATKAQAAEAGAAQSRSPGMQSAYDAEKRRLDTERALRGGARVNDLPGIDAAHVPAAARAPSGGDGAQARSLIAELVKAGASLQLAQETAAKLMQSGQQPITIEVVNSTGGAVDAYVRGEQ